MKINNIIKVTLAVLLSQCAANAATLTFSNNLGAGATNAIVSSSGIGFQNADASVSVGIFSTLTDAQVSAATDSSFAADFNIFGGFTGGFTAQGPGTQNRNGYFSAAPAPVQIAGSTFENQFVYVLVQNNLSAEFLVLKTSIQFSAADDPVLPNVPYTISSSNITDVLIGNFGLFNSPISSADATPAPSYSTAAPIPEPSVALLGAFGVLGLLRRRR